MVQPGVEVGLRGLDAIIELKTLDEAVCPGVIDEGPLLPGSVSSEAVTYEHDRLGPSVVFSNANHCAGLTGMINLDYPQFLDLFPRAPSIQRRSESARSLYGT